MTLSSKLALIANRSHAYRQEQRRSPYCVFRGATGHTWCAAQLLWRAKSPTENPAELRRNLSGRRFASPGNRRAVSAKHGPRTSRPPRRASSRCGPHRSVVPLRFHKRPRSRGPSTRGSCPSLRRRSLLRCRRSLSAHHRRRRLSDRRPQCPLSTRRHRRFR